MARVRPHRTIVRGGSRVTRGKRSVFPKRVYAPSKSSFHVTSQFKYFVPKQQLILINGLAFLLLFHHITDIQFLWDNPQFVKYVGDFLLFLDNVHIYFIHAVFTSFNGSFNGSLINIKNGSEHFG